MLTCNVAVKFLESMGPPKEQALGYEKGSLGLSFKDSIEYKMITKKSSLDNKINRYELVKDLRAESSKLRRSQVIRYLDFIWIHLLYLI
jgi:hypothetical protein